MTTQNQENAEMNTLPNEEDQKEVDVKEVEEESQSKRLTLDELLRIQKSDLKPPDTNPIWSFYWPSFGDRVEEVEQKFTEILKKRHPDIEIAKGDLVVPTTTTTTGRWSRANSKRIQALWVGRPSEGRTDLYFVKAVRFHKFGEGLGVERYDLNPVTKSDVDVNVFLWGLGGMALGVLGLLFAISVKEASCGLFSMVAVIIGYILFLNRRKPTYKIIENYVGSEDKLLKDAVDMALREALDEVGISVPEDFGRGSQEGESQPVV